jgi:hypothetical protein
MVSTWTRACEGRLGLREACFAARAPRREGLHAPLNDERAVENGAEDCLAGARILASRAGRGL